MAFLLPREEKNLASGGSGILGLADGLPRLPRLPHMGLFSQGLIYIGG